MPSIVIRCALIVLALLVGTWLVLSFQAVRLASEGEAVIERVQRGAIPPAEVERGLSALHRAHRFNADKRVLLNEGLLLGTAKRAAEARAIGERVVAEEPANHYGWVYVYLISPDRRRAAEALRRVRALNPLAADALTSDSQTGS